MTAWWIALGFIAGTVLGMGWTLFVCWLEANR